MQPTTIENQKAIPVAWAVKLIERLHLLYGSKFLQQWEGVDKAKMAQMWAEEMAGYSGDEIARGIAACRSRPFPPTLPEFLLLCRPTLSPEAAYHEAVTGMSARMQGKPGEWSHPGIYWAAVRVTSHDLLNMGWQAIRGRWEAALRDVMSKGKWDAVPEPRLALVAPGANTTTRSDAKGFMEQIKRITGASAMPGSRVTDPRIWAQRIIDDPAGRTVAVLDTAKRALEAKHD